jgi:hypothetical protein
MANAHDLDEREDYVVSVVEFSGDTGSAVGALQRVFGLDEPSAGAMLQDVPVEVRRGVNRIRAEYFRRALELSGARVEVRDGEGSVVAALAPAPLMAAKPRAVAAGPIVAPKPAAEKTLVLGSPPANDAFAKPPPEAPAAGGWGDLQPFKPRAPAAPAPARAAASRPPAPASPVVMGGPRELSMSDMPGSDELSLGDPLELDPGELPATRSRGEPRGPVELSTSDLPDAPPLELGVDTRESKPRYDAIPAGEKWKAPGSDTVARARRKQMVQALDSNLSDSRPDPTPAVAANRASPRPSPRIATNTPVSPVQARMAQQTRANPGPTAVRATPTPGFAEVIALAFRGAAIPWTAWIFAAGSAFGAATALAIRLPWIGVPLAMVSVTVLLALCGMYHRHVFWAAATAEDAIEETPTLDAALLRSGVTLTGFAGLTQVLLWLWLVSEISAGHSALSIVGSPLLWVLGFGPAFYWPIALGCAAARNQFRGVWDVARGLRALGRAPGEIARISLASAAVFTGLLAVLCFALSAIGMEGPVGLVAATGLPLAISHALMGAWSGRLLHAHSDVFE